MFGVHVAPHVTAGDRGAGGSNQHGQRHRRIPAATGPHQTTREGDTCGRGARDRRSGGAGPVLSFQIFRSDVRKEWREMVQHTMLERGEVINDHRASLKTTGNRRAGSREISGAPMLAGNMFGGVVTEP